MSASVLHLCLVQFDIAWEDPEGNINCISHWLDDAAEADLILLPEMWSTGFTMQPENAAEAPSGKAVQWMKEFAGHRNTAVAGSVSTKMDDKFVNRFYCVWPDGQTIWYDKKHLFSYGGEDRHYSAGQSRITFDLKGWRVLPVICYDLRFPVWCRNTDDYDLLLVVANWPAPRIHHWDALLRARAIENQCYIAAVNRIGTDGNGLEYSGHSSVYDMNGQALLQMEDRAEVGRVALDKEELAAYRARFRFLQDRDTFYF